MAANANTAKVVAYTIGGLALVGFVFYVFYKLNEILDTVNEIADNQKALPQVDPEPHTIDVTPETSHTSPIPAISPAYAAILAESTIYSGQNEVKALNSQTSIVAHSELDSDYCENPKPECTELRHSEDFRTVNFKGEVYHLTLNQARVTQKLLLAHENHTPEVHQDTLLEKLEIYSKRVRDVFKNSPALGTLIVKGEKRGTFRLNFS